MRSAALFALSAALMVLAPATAMANTTLSPTSLTFSQQVGASSAPQTATLTQDCNGGLDGFLCGLFGSATFNPSITVTPAQFAQTNNCPMTLSATFAAAASCAINVTFSPSAVGAVSGTLSTGMSGPTASLSGTGTPAPPLTPATPAGGKKCKKAKKHSAASAKKKKCGKKKK
jgi:hypothetical protein